MELKRNVPPKFFLHFFRWFCHPELIKYIEGDLMELYEERVHEFGKRKADIKFVIDVLLLFRPGIIRPSQEIHTLNEFSMFKNYFKVGIRNILKYKVFSFINVFGLAAAMSVCMLIILMLADQHRYDQFNEKKDRIYRILSDGEGFRQAYATTPYPLASTLRAEYPIVEEATNLTPGVGGDATYLQRTADMRGYFADPSFFQIFSFELEKGNKSTALTNPNSMVISSELATKLFQQEDPLGKTIEFSDRQLSFPQRFDGVGAPPISWGSFTVTGVIDETKYQSHLKFDVLVSSSSRQTLYMEKKIEDLSNNWEWYFRSYTYVLLDPDKKKEDLTSALDNLVAHKYANVKSEQTKGFKLKAQALGDVQMGVQGNDTDNRFPRIGYYFLSFLAAVIMLSACLNYTNLSIARALTRAKEIGVRKVTGANRKALIFQFLSESLITSILALAMGTLLLLFIRPAFKSLWVNQYLNFELPSTPSVYLIFIGFALCIGLIAGFYPALHLSTYQPIKALKNLASIRPGKLGLRKALTVSQFVISLFFIITSILIFNQFKHFIAFDYGFSSKNLLNIELQGASYQKVANEMSTVPGVTMISGCDIIPAAGRNNNIELKKTNSEEDYTAAGILQADENFTNNLGLKLVAGKNLPPAAGASNRFILVNEMAVKELGYKFPGEIVGQVFQTKWGQELLEVVGVVEDFRYKSLVNKDKIDPLVIRNQPATFAYANVKIVSSNPKATVAKLEDKWKLIDPVHPFKCEFFDDQLTYTHQGIFDLASILGFISFLAITIACLGLLGMATYTAERKTKEVGVRKVLGAADFSIALLLSKEFLRMLMLSILIAAPLSYFVNNLWLQKFPNRVEFGFGTVSLGIMIILLLGCITIGSQTLRAARRNPVDSLKMD
jgi:putative ABC transport system permease protein